MATRNRDVARLCGLVHMLLCTHVMLCGPTAALALIGLADAAAVCATACRCRAHCNDSRRCVDVGALAWS